MNRVEEKEKSSKVSMLDSRSVTTPPVFRYIPRSRWSEGQPPFIEDQGEVQPWRLENEDLQVLKEEKIIPLPNLQLISKDETQKSVKPLGDQVEQEFFPDKRTNEGFDPKAYKLLAKIGYDFTLLSQLGEFSPKTMSKGMHGLNETQKKLKQ